MIVLPNTNILPRRRRRPGFSNGGRRGEAPVISRSGRDAAVVTAAEFGVEAAAVERDEVRFGDGGFADWAMARGRVEMEPTEDTGPAVEMAAEGDDWIGGEVKADIAVKAGGGGGGAQGEFFRRGIELRRAFLDEIL